MAYGLSRTALQTWYEINKAQVRAVTMKYENRCMGCGCVLPVGTVGHGCKPGARWQFICHDCHTKVKHMPPLSEKPISVEEVAKAGTTLPKPKRASMYDDGDGLDSDWLDDIEIPDFVPQVTEKTPKGSGEVEQPISKKSALDAIAENAQWGGR